jgi:hypothetical protein
MFAKRKAFNPKRRLAISPSGPRLEELANKVHYGGNPEHKRNPGDFALRPPCLPRPDKTLCDLLEFSGVSKPRGFCERELDGDW